MIMLCHTGVSCHTGEEHRGIKDIHSLPTHNLQGPIVLGLVMILETMPFEGDNHNLYHVHTTSMFVQEHDDDTLELFYTNPEYNAGGAFNPHSLINKTVSNRVHILILITPLSTIIRNPWSNCNILLKDFQRAATKILSQATS